VSGDRPESDVRGTLLGAELNAEVERTREIEAGMRPEDKEPFLPRRDAPGD
jgi:hypothetical protein